MKKLLALVPIILLTACSGMKEIENRKTYAEPSWYQDCAQAGTEGWFWNNKEYAYACGAGESIHAQAHPRSIGPKSAHFRRQLAPIPQWPEPQNSYPPHWAQ